MISHLKNVELKVMEKITSLSNKDDIQQYIEFVDATYFGDRLPNITLIEDDGVGTFVVTNTTIFYNPTNFNLGELHKLLLTIVVEKHPIQLLEKDKNKLIECLYTQLFECEVDIPKTVKNKILQITTIKEVMPKNNMKLYSNRSNSCYMNTLLSILFLADNGYFITKILREDIDNVVYGKSVCSTKSKIIDVSTFAKQVQQKLKGMFFDVERKIHSAELIRLLSHCNSNIKLGCISNSAEPYTLLCDLFPSLQVKYNRSEADGVHVRTQCLFDMVDLPRLKKVLKSSPDVLVFYNGGIERLTEGLIDWSAKGFDEEILKDRYRLVGVIVHLGLVHYKSYTNIDGKWYEYNDVVSDTAHLIRHLPEEGVFKDTKTSQPSMMFYVKKN